MRSFLRLVVLLALIPSTAAAQTSTDEGIRALLGGDYQTAVRILRPLAESIEHPDPIAQFFMGFLYGAGRGVGINESRACGLFRNAATADNPFMLQSSVLANAFLDLVGGSILCPTEGTWRDLPRASFTLGANHWIVFDDTGITIGYNGTQHRTPLGGSVGAAYLPIRYSALDVSRPVVARRHFIEYFTWIPDVPANPSGWTLVRTLSEVVGDKYIAIGMDPIVLLTFAGSEPPQSIDVDSLTRVRVNANGEAEWIVTNGADQRIGVIPWQESR